MRGVLIPFIVMMAAAAAAAAATTALPAAAGEADATQAALHLDWMDRSADPLQDFFRYANGAFMRDNPIPPAYSSWGQFDILDQHTQDYIHGLLQSAAADCSSPWM